MTEALAAGHAPSAMNDIVATERSEPELSQSPGGFRGIAMRSARRLSMGRSSSVLKQQTSSGISLHRAPSSLSRNASAHNHRNPIALRRISSAAPAGQRASSPKRSKSVKIASTDGS